MLQRRESAMASVRAGGITALVVTLLACVGLVTWESEKVMPVLFSMPPPVQEAPYSRPPRQGRSEGHTMHRRSIIHTARGQQLGSVYPPFYTKKAASSSHSVRTDPYALPVPTYSSKGQVRFCLRFLVYILSLDALLLFSSYSPQFSRRFGFPPSMTVCCTTSLGCSHKPFVCRRSNRGFFPRFVNLVVSPNKNICVAYFES